MPALRIAFISVVPSPYQRDLFAALSRQPGIDPRVFYLEASAPDSPWPEKPLGSHEEVLRGSTFSLGQARFHFNWPLPALGAFDLVVLNITVNALTTQWLAHFGLRGKPWIFWGERLRERQGGFTRTLHDQLIRPLHRAAAIVGVGSRAMEDYRRRFPEPLHFSLPYHCDLQPFLEQLPGPRSGDETVFFYCGQMIARKGVDLLLEAFARLAAENPRARLLLLGREAELPRMLEPLPARARERIEYAGFQPPEKLPGFFTRGDVFVLPSRYDGWGVVVNQALGAGLPVICSDAAGAGFDLVEEGVNGTRFASGDANALHEKMTMAASNGETMRLWGAASRNKALEISPEAGAAKWLSIIRTVLERK